MKRVPVIDLVRLASILVVIGGHFYPRWVAMGYSPLVQRVICDFFLNGAYGVTCFFVVSGFLITQMLASQQSDFSKIDLKIFYAKRAARIFPLLAVIILTGYALEHMKNFLDPRIIRYDPWNISDGFGIGFWSSLAAFNFNWFVIGKGDAGIGTHWAVLWSLAVEEQFYFFYPVVLKCLKKRDRVLKFLGLVVLSAVLFRAGCYFLLKGNLTWMHKASFAAFDQIAIGGLLYFAWEKWGVGWGDRIKMNFFLLASGLILCFAIFALTSINNSFELMGMPTLMAVGCALVIFGGLNLSVFSSSLAGFLSWPGKFSYGCYLWHATIICFFMPLWAWLQGFRAFTVLILLVWTTAWLSYQFLELPANQRIRSFFSIKFSSTL